MAYAIVVVAHAVCPGLLVEYALSSLHDGMPCRQLLRRRCPSSLVVLSNRSSCIDMIVAMGAGFCRSEEMVTDLRGLRLDLAYMVVSTCVLHARGRSMMTAASSPHLGSITYRHGRASREPFPFCLIVAVTAWLLSMCGRRKVVERCEVLGELGGVSACEGFQVRRRAGGGSRLGNRRVTGWSERWPPPRLIFSFRLGREAKSVITCR